jgi:hypothetical protein
MASNTNRLAQPGETSISASGKLQTWGYHNTFSTHAGTLSESNPPSYDYAKSRSLPTSSHDVGSERLPGYSCDVHFDGFLDMRTELSSPFLVSLDNDWHTVYVVLHGTQLNIYKLKKSLFRSSRVPRQGRLLRTYSLQHAEIGVAVDWRKSDLIPRATFARVLPKHAQQKLYETDPELFEPIREFVFRLRIEQEQLIFCAPSHSEMLDWVEEICAGIDVSPPLDDRHEPRYRSLPRRTRRQRQIENAAQTGSEGRDREEIERQIIAEQEEIFRRLYPHLAAASTAIEQARTNDRTEAERENNQEPDSNEFDREDVLGENTDSNSSEPRRQTSSQFMRQEAEEDTFDPKNASPRAPMTYNALCRFRRRCAPILLASSPRASHIIFTNGSRYQIDGRRCQLSPFHIRPPRYDAHVMPADTNKFDPFKSIEHGTRRPSIARGITETSQWSNNSTNVEHEGEASSLHTIQSGFEASHEELDRIGTVAATNEMSFPGKGKAKAILVTVKKISVTPLKPLPRGYHEDAETGMALVAHAPLLV